jgi:hypothetical protein
MRSTILVLVLAFPAILFGQSLADVAKKEKERRESNKKAGKEATVLSEEDIARVRPAGSTGDVVSEEGSGGESGASESYASGSEDYTEASESEESGEDVPTSIPPDLPLNERLDLFNRMRNHYLAQAKEIDGQIRENEAKIRKAQSDLASTSAAGGGGLPVAPGAAPVPGQMTGQESAALADELNRLQAINQQLQTQKEQLKTDLQAKARVAGIPPGYLRF